MTKPIRLHVPAKRYLYAVELGYFEELSAQAMYTLSLQGGPTLPEEVTAFKINPHAEVAVRFRRWDKESIVPRLETPVFVHYRPLIERLLKG